MNHSSEEQHSRKNQNSRNPAGHRKSFFLSDPCSPLPLDNPIPATHTGLTETGKSTKIELKAGGNLFNFYSFRPAQAVSALQVQENALSGKTKMPEF